VARLPFAIVPLIWLTCQRRIMGKFVTAQLTMLIATAVAGLIVILNILLLAQVAGLR
jgi:manganese transport protein